MPNIVLSRIDERLVHGQVGVQWVGFVNANIVVVVDDEVATDSTQQDLMEMVLAEGIAIRFWSVQKTIDNIHKANDRQKILLVAKRPAVFLKMIQEEGFPLFLPPQQASLHLYRRRLFYRPCSSSS